MTIFLKGFKIRAKVCFTKMGHSNPNHIYIYTRKKNPNEEKGKSFKLIDVDGNCVEFG